MSDMCRTFKTRLGNTMPLAMAVLAGVSLAGCNWLRGYADGRSHVIASYEQQALSAPEIGAARFLFDDFHGLSFDTLESTAVPWKLATTALVLHRHPGEPPSPQRLRAILRGFGFVYPERIDNWPLPDQPVFSNAPMGLVTGTIERKLPRIELEAANIGCAGCHASVLHDAQGEITGSAWLGLPNTSLDLDAYAAELVDALAAVIALPRDEVLDAISQLHPDVSDAELRSLRRFVWPRLLQRVPHLLAEGGALPFRNGGPGRSNGVDALKFRLDAGPAARDAAAGVSIPALGGHALRSALLVDGLYAIPGRERLQARTIDDPLDAQALAGIVAFFTTPTMGVDPAVVPDIHPQVAQVSRFLIDSFQPPPFPGSIDVASAGRGEAVYLAHCAQCHGHYATINGQLQLASLPNVRIAADVIGTDPSRLQAVTPALADAVARTPVRDDIAVAISDGYLAPPLTGLWATAPYLHNGSVPTLWHLMHPDQRPRRFQVGGHRLDHRLVGIAGVDDGAGGWRYPDDHRPWSTPHWLDTRVAGFGNGGHEFPFDQLDDTEKSDLLEFLKRL